MSTSLDTCRDGTVSSLVVQLRPLTWLCGQGSGWAGDEAEDGTGGGAGGVVGGGGGVVILKDMVPGAVADKWKCITVKGEGR